MTEYELTAFVDCWLVDSKPLKPLADVVFRRVLGILAERDAEREEKIAFMALFKQVKAERDALQAQLSEAEAERDLWRQAVRGSRSVRLR